MAGKSRQQKQNIKLISQSVPSNNERTEPVGDHGEIPENNERNKTIENRYQALSAQLLDMELIAFVAVYACALERKVIR